MVEGNLDDARQTSACGLALKDGDLPLDYAGLTQPLDPSQTGRRRDMHHGGQGIIVDRGIRLHNIQKTSVDFIQNHHGRLTKLFKMTKLM